MKSSLSPVQRTIRELKNLGRLHQKVEHWNPYGGPRRPDGTAIGNRVDLFGFIDIIALDTERGIVGVQCCAGSGHSAHYKKITADPKVAQLAFEWIRCGGKIELWSWSQKLLQRGGVAMRWTARMQEITAADFEEFAAEQLTLGVQPGDPNSPM